MRDGACVLSARLLLTMHSAFCGLGTDNGGRPFSHLPTHLNVGSVALYIYHMPYERAVTIAAFIVIWVGHAR